MRSLFLDIMSHLSSVRLLLHFVHFCFLSPPLLHPIQAQFLQAPRASPSLFLFTQLSYNASISENSAARTYASSKVKMGIILGPPRSLDIRYSIESGDGEGIFNAEAYVIGDFCFLRIRTNDGGGSATLNREVQDNYTLMVKASSQGSQGSLEALARIHIRILDTNDLRPLFSPTSYSLVVPESCPPGASIGRVTATDADAGPNAEFYYLFNNRVELFAVHPTSGVVTLTGQLRQGVKARFELEVQVVDRGLRLYGDSGVSSTARLVVTVESVNEYPPVLTATLAPLLPEDPVFVVLVVEDADKGAAGEVEWVAIIDGDPLGQFVVDRSPGTNEFRVKTSEPVNWDKFPNGFNLTFQAKDKGTPPKFSNTKFVPLLVKEPEPNMLGFEKRVYNITLSEIAPPGTFVEKVRISPPPLIVNYSFTAPSDPIYFDINPLTGIIVTTQALSTITQRIVELEAIDIISQLQTKLQIIIEEANNNAPVFSQAFYDVDINESLPLDTVVLVAAASDADKAENGRVTHTISGLQFLPFAIDQDTGEVRITRDLDFETSADTFTFSVRASDWGSPYRRESEVNVTVRLVNINDNRPLFERVSCRGMIARDFPIGKGIITLSAIDIDEMGGVRYHILSGNELGYFTLNPNTGALSLQRSLAAANLKRGIFNLKVAATDGEMFSDATFVNLTVVRGRMAPRGLNCEDTQMAQLLAEKMLTRAAAMATPEAERTYSDEFSRNTQGPQFESLPTSILVREDLVAGASVFQVRARDGDAGFNGRILYTISHGNQEGCFNVDMDSGLMTVFELLDRERTPQYFLNLTVYDQGVPQLTSWRLLTIIVEDANDNEPQFPQDCYSALVAENAAIGLEVITVSASDEDKGQNGQVSYTLLSNFPQFRINRETGQVFVSSRLDRETFPAFSLKVEARDKAERGSQRFSVTTLSIVISDVNDCAPAFVLGSYSSRVLEDLPVGTMITWIQAQDPDLDLGGQIQYSLINDFNGTFEVNALTGVLRIGKELDYEKQQFYNLTVLAADRGTPNLRTQTFVEVEVVDVNENLYGPYFSDFAIRGSVRENSRSGTSILTVSAQDRDSGRDGALRYSIRGGSGLGTFSVDEETGVIYSAGILDCETKDSYWLTVCATDKGVIPLSSSIEVFIQVEDVNDNAPLTSDPIYHPVVMENSPKDVSVIRIQAQDPDLTATSSRLGYRITAGNPQNFFSINPKTGLISTTSRKLDREQQAEHFLEVMVMDGPATTRQSTVWVRVHVDDQNDNPPVFPEVSYRVRLPERAASRRGDPVYRVFAYDRDQGANGNITYSIVNGNGDERFSVDSRTAVVSSRKAAAAGTTDVLTIKAEDGGDPPLWTTTRLQVDWIPRPPPSRLPLLFAQRHYNFSVAETAAVAQPVGVVSVRQSSGPLWFDIMGGRMARETFYIPQNACGPNCSLETGSFDMQFDLQMGMGTIVVVRPLDAEVQSVYNMTLQVTDGTGLATAQVLIHVLDANDNSPAFSRAAYDVSTSEETAAGAELLRVRALDPDERARLTYSLYSSVDPASARLFRLNPATGALLTTARLDYKAQTQHILTVMVKDQEVPFNRDLARVLVSVEDSNDNPPYFTSAVYETLAYEASPAGTSLLWAMALDRDSGVNGRLTYSIEAGNSAGLFGISNSTGVISTARRPEPGELGLHVLSLLATDGGSPPLTAGATARIILVLSDASRPTFTQREYQAEVMENSTPGALVAVVTAVARSALVYDITGGDEDLCFLMNPYSGAVVLRRALDFERTEVYSLVVRALSMGGVEASTTLTVQVGDVNDNPPVLEQVRYVGVVSEESAVDSVVLGEGGFPLVIRASDRDRNQNALLVFSIMEETARMFFRVDSGTGSIRTISPLDYETFPEFEFRVHVRDSGQPPRSSARPAEVLLRVINTNDSPPRFSQDSYEAVLLLPTYPGVEVLRVEASDPDLTPGSPGSFKTSSADSTRLVYSLPDSGPEQFAVDPVTGAVSVTSGVLERDRYIFSVKVWDGRFSATAAVTLAVREVAGDSDLRFTLPVYTAFVPENSDRVAVVTVVSAAGHGLGEPLTYALLNGGGRFSVRPTCGVVMTTGVALDREDRDRYELVLEVRREQDVFRVARVTVRVQVEDANDNAPEFVNLPYYASVPVEAEPGRAVFRVSATDRDLGPNQALVYSLQGPQHTHFQLDAVTGELSLRRRFEADASNAEHRLVVVATDGGAPPLSGWTELVVTVVNEAMPVFERPFYGAGVREDAAPGASVLRLGAAGPEGRRVLYTLEDGDPACQFNVGFEDGVLRVAYPLDYESTPFYRLTVKATDPGSGAGTEVDVDVGVLDVNDNAPTFLNASYAATLPETAMMGTAVLQVSARDQDSEANAGVSYHIVPDLNNSSDYFSVDWVTGQLVTARLLDFELVQRYDFIVRATDGGDPALASDVRVTVSVTDSNDNPPDFSQALYEAHVSELAPRGHFVTCVQAFDADQCDSDRLSYSIISGNEWSTFNMDARSGVLSLSDQRRQGLRPSYQLNVSVSDGVFTSASKVTVNVMGANLYSPVFSQRFYLAQVQENAPPGSKVIQVLATDEDLGLFGRITYAFINDLAKSQFTVGADGLIATSQVLDREDPVNRDMVLTVRALDGGGRASFCTVRVVLGDENDNAPRFRAVEYRMSLRADAAPGSLVTQIQATDADAGPNGLVSYSLYSEARHSLVDVLEVERDSGWMMTKSSVAHLQGAVLSFFVKAWDGGEPPRHSLVSAFIHVLPPDAAPPSFSQPQYSFTLAEDAEEGAALGSVYLAAGRGRFGLVAGETVDSNREGTFGVDAETGALRLLHPLDYERVSAYRFKVSATTQKDLTEAVATVDLEVKVLDVNDNPPVFETSAYVATVMEGMPVGTRLVQVRALDPDWGANGQVTYSLGPLLPDSPEDIRPPGPAPLPAPTTPFAIDSKTGWITTAGPVDHEGRSAYRLRAVAWDRGEPRPLSSTALVTVAVWDVNDNPPRFEREVYRGAMREGDPLGEVVAVLSSADRDGTEQNRLASYYITGGNPRGVFGLALVQGEWKVYVSGLLDREQQDRYLLNITASDGLHVARATVEVSVIDANDNSPVCGQAVYNAVYPEDMPINKGVLTVGATDADSGSSADIQYSLFGIGVEDFYMDANTGELRTAAPMDRERTAGYRLIAQATDGGGLFCRAEVSVQLLDVNDNAPAFSLAAYTASVPENAAPKAPLARVQASDPDQGLNRSVVYSLLDSADGVFSIQPASGVLVLERPLDRETRDSYLLRVQATDQAGQPGALASQVDLTVLVLDVNDNAPVFQSRDYEVTVPEDVAVGTEVLRVFAASADIGPNADITYIIRSGNERGRFALDTRLGIISVADDLDFEVCKDYYLTVEAWDRGTPPLSSVTMVTIDLMDVNDNAPAFSEEIYNVLVSEDAAVGQTITRLLAEDLDSQVNGRITYSILTGDRGNQFWIDPVTGLLKVNKRLDRELVSRYSLSVQAFDSGSPAMSSTVSVNVDVTDVNDNPPVFSPPNATAVIQLNQPAGAHLVQLVVRDPDSPRNGPPFEFRLVSGNEGEYFSLDQSGTLLSCRAMGPQAPREFFLEVQATDSGRPRLLASSWVYLRVISDSQYKPSVPPLEVFIVMATASFPGGLVGRIHASDRDVNDVLSYTHRPSPGGMFQVNRQDGSINGLPGLEPGRYQLNATVSDGRFAVIADVAVRVEQLTEAVLRSAVTVRFSSLSPEDLLGRHLGQVRLALRSPGSRHLPPGPADLLHLLGVQQVEGTEDVDLILAMERPSELAANRGGGGGEGGGAGGGGGGGGAGRGGGGAGGGDGVFFSPQELAELLAEARARGQFRGVLAGAEVLDRTCSGGLDCGDLVCEQTLVPEPGATVSYSTERVSLVAPAFRHIEACTCSGGLCSPTLELCEGQSCPSDMQCVRSGATAPSACHCQPDRLDECAGQTSLSFSGNSYIKYRFTGPGQGVEMRLGLRIRTLQTRGVIMFSPTNTCTMLKIEGGRLWFQLECDNTLGIMGISGRPINDGLWHAVALELTHNYTLLSLDDSYVERRRAARAPVRLWPLAPDSSFFFGAQVRGAAPAEERPGPESGDSLGSEAPGDLRDVRGPPRAQDGFQGCLGSLRLNGKELPLQNKRSRYAEVAGLSEVKLGCLLYPDPCVGQPCLNGALCSSLPSGGFRCSCSPGFTGGRCEAELTSCLPNPCQNGGDCKPLGGSFLCGCPRGLVGVLCEEDVNECLREECANGGGCVNTYGAFYCNCSVGFEGQLCGAPSDEEGDMQAEPLSYIGPGEMVGVGVLVSVVVVLLVVFAGFRRKLSLRKEPADRAAGRAAAGVSTVTSETGYMLRETACGEFQTGPASGGFPSWTTGCLGDGGGGGGGSGGGGGGPPQVMVRPNCHSPQLPGDLCRGQGTLRTNGDRPPSSEGSQLSSFLSNASHLRGGTSRRGVAVCSVAPNLPSTSQRHSEHSPAHKTPWVAVAAGGRGGRKGPDDREQEWGQRAFQLERTQLGASPPAEDTAVGLEETQCLSDSLSDRSLSSFTSESFDDDASVVTVIRLVNNAADRAGSEAYHWRSPAQPSMWLSPSRLRPPELASHRDFSEAQQAIRRGGSMRSLQLDYQVSSPGGPGGPGALSEPAGTSFQWDRTRSRGRESSPSRPLDGHAKDPGGPGWDPGARCENVSSPVYEEYGVSETESLYDTLPPTRRALDGPRPPPGLHLHPAQLQPPLRAWGAGQQAEGCPGPEAGPREAGGPAGAGDELERLLNLVSLRARRATRTHMSSTSSEPTATWEGL